MYSGTLIRAHNRKMFIFFILLSISTVIGQSVELDDLEEKDGKFFHNGKLFSGLIYQDYFFGGREGEGHCVDGLVHGKWTDYYRNGKRRYVRNYTSGIETGPYTEYFESGNIKEEGQFLSGKLDGEIRTYFESGKRLQSRIQFRNGKRNGSYYSYYSDGSPLQYTEYLNDVKHGKEIFYDERGIKKIEIQYQNGEFHGWFIDYMDNGNISMKTYYQNGVISGKSYVYDENGKLLNP